MTNVRDKTKKRRPLSGKFICKLITISYALVLAVCTHAGAETSSSAALQEGLERTLNPQQYAEVVQWAASSASSLKDLLRTISSLNETMAIEQMSHDIQQVVLASAPKNSEVLMRFVLNRGIYLDSILKNSTPPNLNQHLRYFQLKNSIELALKYYQSEFENSSPVSMSDFSLDYFNRVNHISSMVFDQTTRVSIKVFALEIFHYDLSRDAATKDLFSHIILIIRNQTERFHQNQSTLSVSEQERTLDILTEEALKEHKQIKLAHDADVENKRKAAELAKYKSTIQEDIKNISFELDPRNKDEHYREYVAVGYFKELPYDKLGKWSQYAVDDTDTMYLIGDDIKPQYKSRQINMLITMLIHEIRMRDFDRNSHMSYLIEEYSQSSVLNFLCLKFADQMNTVCTNNKVLRLQKAFDATYYLDTIRVFDDEPAIKKCQNNYSKKYPLSTPLESYLVCVELNLGEKDK